MKDINLEVYKCKLCKDAPCSKNCNRLKPDKIIRSVRFDNLKGACSMLENDNPCLNCDAASQCELNCPGNVEIKNVISSIGREKDSIEQFDKIDIDITTDICGVKLENPFLLSSSVVASNYDMCKRAFDHGWAGVVFKTICLMDIHEASPRFSALKGWDNTFYGFKNIEQLSDHSLEENLEIFKELKKNYPNKVIVASIMGRNESEWEYLAKKVTEAGADAIELNFSCPNMELKGTGSDVGQDPDTVYKYTCAARRGTTLPLIAKMTPNITDIKIPARAAVKGGANGISAINTIKSITNVDLDTFVPEPVVHGKSSLGGYSGQAVKPIALRYISELSNDKELSGISISGIGGINTWKDAVEFMLLGSSSVQVTTAVMEYGYRIVEDLIDGLKIFLKEKGFKSIKELVGISKDLVVDADELERDTILYPVFNYEKCIGCGRCNISCMDGGHQAIKFDSETRKPILDASKCVGCHLCKLVCPEHAIGIAKKRVDVKN